MNKWRIGLIVSYILLIAYAVISIFPFMWSALVSITPMKYTDENGVERGVDIMKWPPDINFFRWPVKVFGAPGTLSNYLQIFRITPYARWILNTVLYALLVTIGHLLFDTLGGYAFAKLRFPLKNFWFTMFLATLMIPGHVTMIPNYSLMVKFGFVNTYYGLFIPKLTGVFGLFLIPTIDRNKLGIFSQLDCTTVNMGDRSRSDNPKAQFLSAHFVFSR